MIVSFSNKHCVSFDFELYVRGQRGNHGGQYDDKLRMIKENPSESIQYNSVSDGESI